MQESLPSDINVTDVERCLAQTQCTECGYKGCKPYAEDILRNKAPINLCRPGGERVIRKLAELLGREVLPPAQTPFPPQVVFIDEDVCIGCTKCIQACPTDAIVGASKMKHTVFLADCTGCRLCLPVCPVDCITLVPVAAPADPESRAKKVHQLVETKQQRQAAGLARQLAAVEEHLEVPLPVAALPAAVQEKVDAARRQAQHKWQNKKAARPRHLVHKERGN